MFRDILQCVACLSIFTSVLSLHIFDRNSPSPQNTGIDSKILISNQNESPSSNFLHYNINDKNDASGVHLLQEPSGPNTQINRKQHYIFNTKTYDNILQGSSPSDHWIHFTPYFTSKKRAMNNDISDHKYGDSGSVKFNSKTLPTVPQHGIANQLMLRSARGQRQYDVPQIECPPAMDGMERFACPSPDRQGRYRCIDDHVLCDGFIDCPEGEDEDRQACMFYKTTKAHLDVLADALLRWARGR